MFLAVHISFLCWHAYVLVVDVVLSPRDVVLAQLQVVFGCATRSFLLAELGTSGTLDGSNALVLKGRFQQKQMESVLRRYIRTYTVVLLFNRVQNIDGWIDFLYAHIGSHREQQRTSCVLFWNHLTTTSDITSILSNCCENVHDVFWLATRYAPTADDTKMKFESWIDF